MPSKEEIAALYKRYLDNDISEDELENFLALLDTPADELTISSLMDGTWEEMFEAKEVVVVPMYKRTWYKVAAAVIIIMMLSAGTYFIFNKGTQKQIAKSGELQFKNDIAPGGNKAILTLSNGSTIVLDNANNGLLTQQGNTKVVKLQGGKVVYRGKESGDMSEVEYNTITTPRGGQYQLQLADGSQVWLNAASSITFPTSFAGTKRTVSITGEAYFEVTHNQNMPFIVKHGDMEVKVLGTHFNVKTYGDDPAFEITLLEGSVKVSKRADEVMLSPGWQAVIQPEGNIKIDKGVNLEEVMAWKNGKFVFERADIQTVMRGLSRWYNMDVAYEGNVTAHFEGSVSMHVPISKVFEMLEMAGGVKFEIEGQKVIIMPDEINGK